MAMEFGSSIAVSEPVSCRSSSVHASCKAYMSLLRPSANLTEHNSKPFSSSSSSSSSAGIPIMEPFNRGRVSRLMKEPSLLEKAEHDISDRCSILEGDDAYTCWEALFDLEKMKEEYSTECSVASQSEQQTACRPLERLEHVVRQSGGVVSLINNVRMLCKVNEMRKSMEEHGMQQGAPKAGMEEALKHGGGEADDGNLHFFLEPGSLPPSEEELELERSAKMPESSFTRVLRTMGIPSPWFGQHLDTV